MLLLIAVLTAACNILWKPYIFQVRRDLRDRIDTISLPKVLEGDNNKYESIGTGRMIAVYSK
ncbi:MAG: hypothetical protein H6765_03180 [Candidatus Peribacteria bacterium]|nr:MAG: hypothetical protein H6765_03180 [Candidatus Peribacteria bacterium]